MKRGELVVVEGMDNTGKSLLAEKLSHITGYPIVKPVPTKGPAGMTGESMVDWLKEKYGRLNLGAGLIFDRCSLVSEQVYGPICRNGSRFILDFGQARYEELVMEFLSYNPILVFCRIPKAEILKSMNDRPQMDGVQEKAQDLINGYNRFFMAWAERGIRFHVHDYTQDPRCLEAINYVIETINERGK